MRFQASFEAAESYRGKPLKMPLVIQIYPVEDGYIAMSSTLQIAGKGNTRETAKEDLLDRAYRKYQNLKRQPVGNRDFTMLNRVFGELLEITE